MAEAERTEQEWAYAGEREMSDGSVNSVFYRVIDGALEDQPRYFELKGKLKPSSVGGVYKVMASPDGNKLVTSSLQWKRTFNGVEATEWRVQHDALKVVRNLKSKQRAEKDLPLECLEPIRKAYYRAPSFDHQLAIEMLVLRYLRRGPR